MFIGHFAVALGAKKAAKKVSLGTLVLAVQFLDLLWPILLILGVEHFRIVPGITESSPFDFTDYPISHSLLMSVVWAICIGGLYYIVRRDSRGAFIIGACVVSHWILDFITHRPDMPLTPGNTSYVGLGLWNSLPATIIVEAILFLVGIILYVRTTKPIDAVGKYAFWSFVGFLALMYALSIGSVPPSESAIGWGGLSMWLFVPWGYWIDRHRRVE